MARNLMMSLFGSSKREENETGDDSIMSQEMDTDLFHNGDENANSDIYRLRANSTKSSRPESFKLLRAETSQFFKDTSASTSNFVENAKEWRLGLNRSLSFDRDGSSREASTDRNPDMDNSSSCNMDSSDGRSRPLSFDLAKSFLTIPPDFIFSKKRTQHPSEDRPGKSGRRADKENSHINTPHNYSGPDSSFSNYQGDSRMQTDYHIIDVIGSGTFGSVYRAKRKLDNCIYAVKQSRQQARSNQDRSLMMREVHALALLNAESMCDTANIVRYFSSWMEDEYLYIQMELCEASVDLVYFDTTNIIGLLRDMLHALTVIHRLDIAHLDIKPGNILLKNNRYKLCDFGMSLKTEEGVYIGDIEEGDTRYMAQELLEWSCRSDLRKCDIFSLGITGYELVCGKPVASEGSQWLDLRSSVFDFPESVPGEVAHLLMAMMGSTPAQRPTSLECFRECDFLRSDVLEEVDSCLQSRLSSLEGNK